MLKPLRLAAMAVCALLALPAVATAHPAGHGLRGAHPFAARVCARADAGRLPAKLASSADQIKADCATLKTSVTSAQDAFDTAVAPLVQQAKDAIAQAQQTCQTARQSGDRAACQAARQQARTTLQSLRSQLRTAARTYVTALKTARKTFWSAIRSLRGGAAITPDAPVDPAPPADTTLG